MAENRANPQPPVAYRCCDDWLLLSIMSSAGSEGDGVDLKSIVATGDWINHAIFTFEEVNGGLARLAAGGWIVFEQGMASLTEQGRRLKDAIRSKGLRASQDHIEKELNVPAWFGGYDPTEPDPIWHTPGLGVAEHHRAVAAYRKEVAAATKKRRT